MSPLGVPGSDRKRMCAGGQVPSVGSMTGQNHAAPARTGLGLPLLAVAGLALLAVPRVVLHDLGVLDDVTLVNALLVFGPPVIWVVVAVAGRIPRPFLTLLTVGAGYGVLLAVAHQLLWHVAFADDPPALGGNLADLDPGVQAVFFRTFAFLSSVFTGVIVGAISGLVAWGLTTLTRR